MQKQKTQADYWAAWEAGIELEAVLITDADESVSSDYKSACKKILSAPDNTASHVEDLWRSLVRAADLLPDAFCLEGTGKYYPIAPPEMLEEWNRDFIKIMRKGHLRLLGFLAPRKPNSRIELAPADIWEGEIDWRLSSIYGNGLDFVAVRIVQERDVLSPNLDSGEIAVLKSHPGRRTRKNQAIAAATALFESSSLDLSLPKKSLASIIRKQVQKMYPDDPLGDGGLSNPTIYPWIDQIKIMFKNR